MVNALVSGSSGPAVFSASLHPGVQMGTIRNKLMMNLKPDKLTQTWT